VKRVIRLTESDLTRIVRRVIQEQATTLPDGEYFGEGPLNNVLNSYELQNLDGTPTGFKVIDAPLKFRAQMSESKTTITGGVPNSEDWGEGGQIVKM
jgi:hypothetical protein